MTSPAPTHPSYDMSFLGDLFTAASQLQQKETGHEAKSPVADQHQSSSLSDHHEKNSKPHHQHQESPASVSVVSSITGPGGSGSSPVSPIAPPARPSLSHIPVQLSENDQCIRLRFNLKGIKGTDISVGVQHGILMVQGIRFVRYAEAGANDEDKSDGSSSVVQRHRFCRRFAIDTDVVDVSKIKANLSGAGVLTVVGPKKSTPSTVHVNVMEREDEQEDEETTKKPEGAKYDSIVSFLLDQANAAGRNNGMGGSVSLSSFSGSGSHSSGSQSSCSEDDEAMEDTPRSSSKPTSSQ